MHLIEIAKSAARNGDKEITKYIDNYGIDKSTSKGRQALIEIAQFVAGKYETTTAEMFKTSASMGLQRKAKKPLFI